MKKQESDSIGYIGYITVITYRKDGWVETEKRGTAPLGDECRACNPNCPNICEDCIKASMYEDEIP